ncbi:MAG TPA: CHAD domain-containing protein [Solirubrobacteraceae bacterium]|nr:CHAD domain-containing protein [Solirubrobacteraceae bacterium]
MAPPAIQLLLPDGLTAAAVADALADRLAVVTQRAHAIDREFWDTFDGRLHGAGLALAAAGGRLVLSDAASGAEEASADLPRGGERLFAGDLPAGALRDRAAPLVEMRALAPIARVRSRFLPVNVLDDVGKIVVRLRVEEPVARAGAAKLPLAPRLHVTGVLGYDREFERVRDVLCGELGMMVAKRAVQDDAVRAGGGVAGGVSSKLKVQLRADARADAAAVVISRRLLDVVETNLPGTLADLDSEFLHDLRVAVRRSRALQRELAGVFPSEPLRVFRAGFKELQAITGPTRDLDVQLLEFDDLAAGLPEAEAGDVAPLRRLLEDHLRAARTAMVAELSAPRTRALLDNWGEFLDALVQSDESDRRDAARPVTDVAAERIAAVYKRMVKMGSRIDADSPAEALHDLRKKGKELRYLLEFFSSLYPPEVVKPMVASLKGLQDVLGRFQDREVQAEYMRSLGGEVAELDGGAPALMAMGVLVQGLIADQAAARTEFQESFAAFSAKEQRALVKATFA